MRHILHADLDAFYASVEQRDNPRLRGKPVVVGGSPNSRGVVAAASYEARRFGVRSAMPMITALQRCPQAIRVDPRFHRYGEVSSQVVAMFREITPLVEPLSLDEAHLDVTDSVSAQRPPGMIAAELKAEVRTETGLTISVGVATSKSVAKIASEIDKPDGLTVVPPGTEREFLAPLSVDKLWGVGPKTAARLADDGVHRIGDLASASEEWLRARFGRMGPFLGHLARGEDDRPVAVERERKSVSAETTLATDSGDPGLLFDLVARLSDRVGQHLARNELRGKTVRVKLRLADFTTFTRQTTLSEPAGTTEVVTTAARELLRRELQPGRLFRLVGVSVSGFEAPQEQPGQPRLAGFE